MEQLVSEGSDCNCWIGIMNDYCQTPDNELYLDDYIKKINGEYKYIDERWCWSRLFKYCPMCGRKIDWKKLRKQAR